MVGQGIHRVDQRHPRRRRCFAGHYQPHLPADLGFYDLRVPEVRGEQGDLAQTHGIDGFCYYHYWFDGRRLLERPLDERARPAARLPVLPLCWANENWTRAGTGSRGEILSPRPTAPASRKALAASTLPHFADPRYARPDGRRPRFLVYRPSDLPDPAGSSRGCAPPGPTAGHAEVELGAVLFHVEGESAVAPALFDFWVECRRTAWSGRRLSRRRAAGDAARARRRRATSTA